MNRNWFVVIVPCILYPECDSAIEDIVNEAIVSDTNDSPVTSNCRILMDDSIKKIIREEFRYILELLDFDKKSHEIFRNWYIDGRIFYNKVIDQKNPNEGIQELRYIDSQRWDISVSWRRKVRIVLLT